MRWGIKVVFGVTLLVAHAQAQTQTANGVVDGRVIHLKQASPVFASPSPKAKILADVENGTTVIVRKLSPRKTWLLVEDEDKNQGWVPRNRTDFADLSELPPPEKKTPKPTPPAVQNDPLTPMDMDPKDDPIPMAPSLFGHYLALQTRRSFTDPNGAWASGPTYAFFLPRASDARYEHRMAFQTAYLWAQKKGESKNFTVPLRFRMLSRAQKSGWATGTDFTLYYMRRPSDRDPNMWSMGLGYSGAYLPRTSGFVPTLRAGLEVFHKTRFSLEASLGYLL